MSKIIKPLTDTKCVAAKPADADYTMFDGAGLFMVIKATGTKVWRYKFKRPNGKAGLMTFGNYPAVSLSAARDKRRECERLLAEGIDPIDHKNKQQARINNEFSFEKVARAWHAAYKKTGKWGDETADRALKDIENHLFPKLGYMSVDVITTRDINKVLVSIEEQGIYEVLKKSRQRLVHIFAYAIRQGYIEMNPAFNLQGSTSTRKAKHYPALPLKDLPDFFNRLNNVNATRLIKLCTELTLHTFLRSSEIRFSRWSEINIDFTKKPNYQNKIWEIPPVREPVKGVKHSHRGSKMKAGHMIPLSKQAIDLLYQIYEVSGYSEHIFPNRNNIYRFMSENSVNKVLRNMGYDTQTDVCGHGFRSMAYGALRECKLFDRDAVEMQMSHFERNATTAAYSHTIQFIEERRVMLDWWSRYLVATRDEYITPYEFGRKSSH